MTSRKCHFWPIFPRTADFYHNTQTSHRNTQNSAFVCERKIDIKIIFTINIKADIEWSVYITSFSAEMGQVSFNFDATNIHAAPKSWSLDFEISHTDRNLSK